MRFWLLILLGIATQYAYATEIGEISELRGNAEITRLESSDTMFAELASDIFSYDDVRTGKGRVAIEFLDSSVLKLTEHSKVVIEEFIFDPDPSKSKLALNMASGTARFITGKLGMINKENISIKTPSATIGIRGTDFTTTVDELGRSLVILLPNADGTSSGEITVKTWAGTEVLNEPFQATMVTTFESRPTPPVTLGNLTLGMIDNLLIVNKPPAIVEAVAQQESGLSPTADLDKDFLDDAPDLDCDFLVDECGDEEDEVTRLDIDLLNVEFLLDLLAIMETGSKKKGKVTQLNGVELEGIIAGYDPLYQTYTFVEDGYLFFVHEGQNRYDIGIDTSAGTYLYLDNAGVIMEVNVNGAGDNVIIITQSP